MSTGPTVVTFGCRLNAYESEVIRRHAATAGLSDTIVVHTCAVTAEAERQARQAIRRARREHPRARIVVTESSEGPLGLAVDMAQEVAHIPMEDVLPVPESVLSAARVGSAVSVQLDAVPGSNFAARVVEIAPQGDPASHTFTVKAELPEESGARAGMFGRLRLTVGQARQILVPAEAVREREGLHYVWVVQDGRAALRLVTVGDRMGESYPVLSGLREGERIVRSGGERVRDGARIAE